MKGPPSFLLQPKLIWLVALFSNYSLYDSKISKLKKSFDISLLLVPLEIILHYLDTDISQWLRENVQWIIVNVFRGKLMV